MNPPRNDSAETNVERLSSTVQARLNKAKRGQLINRGLSLLAILFVGWHLASFVTLLREIRDRIQDHKVIIELDITEKRIEDAPKQIEAKPNFWRGT